LPATISYGFSDLRTATIFNGTNFRRTSSAISSSAKGPVIMYPVEVLGLPEGVLWTR